MRSSGAIIELTIGLGLALLMAILLLGKVDQLLPSEPRQVSCSIVKEQIVCKDSWAKK